MGSTEAKPTTPVQFDSDERGDEVRSYVSEENSDPLELSFSESQNVTELLRTQKKQILDLKQKLSGSNKDLVVERQRSKAVIAKFNSQINMSNDDKDTHLRIDPQTTSNEKQRQVLENYELVLKIDDLDLKVQKLTFRNQLMSSENQELAQEKRDMAMMMQKMIRVSRDHETEKYDLMIGNGQLKLNNYKQGVKIDDLSEQIEDMIEDKGVQEENLSVQNRNLRVQIQNLGVQVEDLSQQIEDKDVQNQNLTVQNQNLTVQCQNLTVQNQNLSVQIEDLSDKNKDLTVQNQNLSVQIEDMSVKIENLSVQNRTLSFEKNELTRVIHRHQAEMMLMEEICLRLKRKNLGRFGRKMGDPEVELERMRGKMRASGSPPPSHLPTDIP